MSSRFRYTARRARCGLTSCNPITCMCMSTMRRVRRSADCAVLHAWNAWGALTLRHCPFRHPKHRSVGYVDTLGAWSTTYLPCMPIAPLTRHLPTVPPSTGSCRRAALRCRGAGGAGMTSCRRCPIIGLTGPTGAGKGVVSGICRRWGIPSIDTDAVYHALLEPPSACFDGLVASFGTGICNPDGTLNRPALSAIVFAPGASDKLELLNRITHGFVLTRCGRCAGRRRRRVPCRPGGCAPAIRVRLLTGSATGYWLYSPHWTHACAASWHGTTFPECCPCPFAGTEAG